MSLLNRNTLLVVFLSLNVGALSACPANDVKDGGEEVGDGGDQETADEEGTDTACNPVTQDCDGEMKCTWVFTNEDQSAGETTCVADGTVASSGDCLLSSAGTGGYDNCTAGNTCIAGKCAEICQATPDSCALGSTCVRYSDFFADRDGVGACVLTCDALLQNCDGEQGCYVNMETADAHCANPYLGSGTGLQGEACTYLNGCAKGYGCALVTEPGSSDMVCAFYCDVDAVGVNPCTAGPGDTFECRALLGFYDNASADLPANLGICVDPAVWPAG